MRAIVTALILSFMIATESAAQTQDTELIFPDKFVHVRRAEIPRREFGLNFAYKYALQWSFYLVTQHETIKDHGSFRQWRQNPFSPHFDRDNLENNVIRHTLAGGNYYLYYRSYGYDERTAFLWSSLSSLAFEFTIETVTERPSYQDLALTSTFGMAAGIALEKLSAYFHEKRVWPARFLGFVLNPYSVFPHASYEFRAHPILSKDKLGASLEWRF